MQIVSAKAQERGFATIPLKVRKLLGIKKGTTLNFVIFDDGRVELRATPEEKIQAALTAFDKLGELFKEQGVTMEQFINASREERGRLVKKKASRR